MDYLQAAKAERETLLKKISSLDREREEAHARLQKLNATIDVLPTLGVQPSEVPASTVSIDIQSQAVQRILANVRARNMQQAKVIGDAAASYLMGGNYIHTQGIVNRLAQDGHKVVSENVRNRVSQILSKDDRFGNDRTNGWFLKSAVQKANATSVTSTGGIFS